MNYRVSKTVKIGGTGHVDSVLIGGENPVVIQSMFKDRLSPADLLEETERSQPSLVKRIKILGLMGCRLLRFAVPDLQTAETLGLLSKMVKMPLVADIHFDYKLALTCMDYPIAKIRINPGNIGSKDKVRQVLTKAADKGVAIRIGVNAGSLPLDLRKKAATEGQAALVLAEAALREIAYFDEFGFTSYLVSIKASGIADTILANQILAQKTDTPLHLGVTEAGPLIAGISRTTAALVPLLAEGLGDTVRVSLSDTMENEVIAGREIIRAASEYAAFLGQTNIGRLGKTGVKIVSCPRCGRYGFDTHSFTERWLSKLYALNRDITIAIMGCEVNGPEEAKHADLGFTGAGNKVLIFRFGKIIKTIDVKDVDKVFDEELEFLGTE